MKMGRWAFMLVLALLVALRHAAAGLPLREQLALAEKEDDTYAQIELSRRILETEPRDAALRARLADLWLSIDDLEMAESIVRDWKEAPAALRAKVLATVLFVREGKKTEAIALLERYLDRASRRLGDDPSIGRISGCHGRAKEGCRST